MTPSVADLLTAVDKMAPWCLAEPWDNSGLQVGDRRQEVSAVAIALGASSASINQAADHGAQLLLTHHPLIFKPFMRLDIGDPAGRLMAEALNNGLTVASAHTNVDVAPSGLAARLAELIGLTEVELLSPESVDDFLTMVVYLPPDHAEEMMTALTREGAGEIGLYGGCFFAAAGDGYYTPMAGAKPYRGEIGQKHRLEEVRLETRIHKSKLEAMRQTALRHHPYQEPVINFYSLCGVTIKSPGRIGSLEISPAQLLPHLKKVFSCSSVRVSGRPPEFIKRVAVVPGSGGDMVSAASSSADVFVTGELKYHQALEAVERGLWTIEVGHDVSEKPVVPLLGRCLRREAEERNWQVRIIELTGDEYLTLPA